MPKRSSPALMYRAEHNGTVHKLYIYDAVRAKGSFNWNEWKYEESETSAKYFRDRLDEVKKGDMIELHVNSAGGEIGEGVTIYNLLRQKSAEGVKIAGYVDGMAYSVAMNIIMAADEIHMGLGTSMFLHNPWAEVAGNAEQLRNMADQLDTLAAASRQLYMARGEGHLTEDELKEMMDKETMLAPNDCLKYGFCDFVGEENVDTDADDNDDQDDQNDDDDRDDTIKQLKEQLFRQQQINMVMAATRPATVKETVFAALDFMK